MKPKNQNTKCAHLIAAIVVATATLSSNISLAVQAKNGSVYLRGDPGSWVGSAIRYPEATWVQEKDGRFSTTLTPGPNSVSVLFSGFDYNYGYNSWNFYFAAPKYDPLTNANTGSPLKVGLYQNAVGKPGTSTIPVMTIGGNGNGESSSIGWFNILDIAFDSSGTLLRLAVDFKQFGNSTTMSGPGIYGSLRFNDPGIPLTTIPVPAAAWLLGSGLVGLVGVGRRKLRD